jgi:molybdate transport system ATP-binding protein
MAMNVPALEFHLIKKLHAFGGSLVIDTKGTIDSSEFIAVYGSSGAGKTTLLRMLAGLTQPDSGYVRLNGRVLYDSSTKINMPAKERRVGFLFQDYALFPNMTVFENIAFALRSNSSLKNVDTIIETMELSGLSDKYPETLSGGQKQRVALARTLVERPDILLLDEPLSALDYEMKERLQNDLERIFKEYSIPTIMVSHNPSEIIRLAEYVMLLKNGSLSDMISSSIFFKNFTKE